MKISNNLITSIACYRKHFDFHAVWGQLDIFLRDMSPEYVPYPDENSELLYSVIKAPTIVEVNNKHLLVDGKDNVFAINDITLLEIPILKNKKYEDAIKILAIFELASQKVTEEALANEELVGDLSTELRLKNGNSVKLIEQDYVGLGLTLRKITVDPQSYCSSIVDGVEIQPGKFVYGVFSGLGLHKVLSPIAQNDVYRLRLAINESGTVETLIYNKLDGTQIRISNVCSFCTIGQDNYVYVENNMVYCHHNEVLARRIMDEVGFLDSPLFVQLIDDKIVITMKNGKNKCIN